ncbi:ATP-binding protein [Caproiciproducens faecalis]|uniref:4Fe-4S binding protein n=1 Tax=Caproiciproducens faecalis TaxID=2820301 RepID=A0ABS7DM86_9FIRM|nr:4Fe-4S binding protein [Caproiciproducens faecalis]MBW7572219.1 4Fe-4S binding protein [Caproiciproducens faecalis]
MKRNIVHIDSDKCNGCGLCVSACQEGALQLINGKATLVSDSYCDGLGNCLPECPTGAIQIIEREAEEYDQELVDEKMKQNTQQPHFGGCPSMRMKTFDRAPAAVQPAAPAAARSELRQWPVQLKLVAPNAPYLQNAHIVICADCTAYACANIHQFMKNKITLIGCPKLDNIDYSEKILDILNLNDIQSITVVRMEVPCCGGIVNHVKTALQKSGQMIPWHVVTIATDGEILDN